MRVGPREYVDGPRKACDGYMSRRRRQAREQNARARRIGVLAACRHAACSGCAACIPSGGMFTVTFTGWPHPGIGNAQRRRNRRRLDGVELPHPARHEEALDEAKNRRNPRPEEAEVENAQAGAAQIEVVNAEAAQKQRQQNAHDLVAAHRLVLLIEDRLRVGIRRGCSWLVLLALACIQDTQPAAGAVPGRPHRQGLSHISCAALASNPS